MKKKISKFVKSVALIFAGTLVLAGCGKAAADKKEETGAKETKTVIKVATKAAPAPFQYTVDKAEDATILNVAVEPRYQGLSIGRRLVVGLAEQISAEVIVLNTHPGAAGFYNRITEYRRNKYVFEKQTGGNPEKAMDPERRKEMFTPKGYRFPEEYD